MALLGCVLGWAVLVAGFSTVVLVSCTLPARQLPVSVWSRPVSSLVSSVSDKSSTTNAVLRCVLCAVCCAGLSLQFMAVVTGEGLDAAAAAACAAEGADADQDAEAADEEEEEADMMDEDEEPDTVEDAALKQLEKAKKVREGHAAPP